MKKITFIIVFIIVAILAATLIAIVGTTVAREIKVKQAVIEDCTLGKDRDYIFYMERCNGKSSLYPNAKWYICWVYTNENGLEVVYARYYKGEVEVFES